MKFIISKKINVLFKFKNFYLQISRNREEFGNKIDN